MLMFLFWAYINESLGLFHSTVSLSSLNGRSSLVKMPGYSKTLTCKNISSWYWEKKKNQLCISFYCCITDHHKLSSLKWHTLMMPQFPWGRCRCSSVGCPMLRVSQGCNQGISQVRFPTGGLTGEESASKLTHGSWQNSLPSSCKT